MANRDAPFKLGEWYHCYNQSIERRLAFVDSEDYVRFLELLYLANDEWPLRRNDIGIRKFEEVLGLPRDKKLVAIGAFCLMTDGFHLALQETTEGGITAFMRKIGTAYTLYFNTRHKRTGNLFLKPFKSRHTTPDSLLDLVAYVHASPAKFYEPEWRNNHVVDPQFLEEHLLSYPYSSLGAYAGTRTPNTLILDTQTQPATRISLQKMLQGARRYAANSGIF